VITKEGGAAASRCNHVTFGLNRVSGTSVSIIKVDSRVACLGSSDFLSTLMILGPTSRNVIVLMSY